FCVKNAGHAVNLGGLERLFKGKRREYGRHALGKHGLARARGADHEDVVASGTGDFHGTLSGLLAANVFEVDGIVLAVFKHRVAVHFDGSDAVAGVHEVNDVDQRADGVDVEAGDHGGFAGVDLGDNQAGQLLAAGFDSDRKSAANTANAAVEREF